jgi:pimeloyl-ACP methyl ester carboxylesterase
MVEPGVTLEVLDWGGTGELLVLLTGLGDNAHVYDHFAYQFTDSFHVIGITRRGFGRSSQAAQGYDIDTRARDDLKVLDAFRVQAAVFAGHSLSGDELSKLGARYPDRVKKLVYLDAYDYKSHASVPQPPPAPDFTAAELASIESFAAVYTRYQGMREPNAALCQSFLQDAAGRIVDSVTPPEIFTKMRENPEQAEYDRIQAPALGIFYVWTPETRLPHYWYLGPAQQAEYDRTFKLLVEWQADAIARFRTGIKNSQVIELLDSNHYVYIVNEAQVVREMRKFLLDQTK